MVFTSASYIALSSGRHFTGNWRFGKSAGSGCRLGCSGCFHLPRCWIFGDHQQQQNPEQAQLVESCFGQVIDNAHSQENKADFCKLLASQQFAFNPSACGIKRYEQQRQTNEAAIEIRFDVAVVGFIQMEVEALRDTINAVAHPKAVITGAEKRVEVLAENTLPDIDPSGEGQIATHAACQCRAGVKERLADQQERNKADDIGLEVF